MGFTAGPFQAIAPIIRGPWAGVWAGLFTDIHGNVSIGVPQANADGTLGWNELTRETYAYIAADLDRGW